MSKTKSKPVKKYHCTQNQLYAICMLAWNSCNKHILNFTALKAYYIATFIANKIAEVLAANNILDSQSSINISERLRNNLTLLADECCAKWQILKVYIEFTYDSNTLKTRLQDAGEDLYKQAASYNWEILAQLMKKGSEFIAANLTELQANDNMPATFQAEFDQLKVDAVNLYVQFQNAMDNAEELTTQKIEANNQIFKDLMIMCKDGQQIFRKNRAIKEEFIFTQLLKRVKGTTTAFHDYEIPPSNSIVIENIVANSPFLNIGTTELVLCNGNETCTPQTGITLQSGETTTIQPNITTITVLNINTGIIGKCKTRVIKN